MYALVMSFLSFVLGGYLLAVGLGWYTPKTRKPLSEQQIQKFRKASKIAAPALFLLGILYALQANTAA